MAEVYCRKGTRVVGYEEYCRGYEDWKLQENLPNCELKSELHKGETRLAKYKVRASAPPYLRGKVQALRELLEGSTDGTNS